MNGSTEFTKAPQLPARPAQLQSILFALLLVLDYGQTPPYYYASTGTPYYPPTGTFPLSNYMHQQLYPMLTNSAVGQRVFGPARGVLQLVDTTIQAFNGIAHTIDTTFIATLTSVNAVVALRDQLRSLKRYLFSLATGQKLAGEREHRASISTRCVAFLTATILVPYLLNKLITKLSNSNVAKQKNEWIAEFLAGKTMPISNGKQFAVTMFAFGGEREGDLRVAKGEIVAVLDAVNAEQWDKEPQWLRCRTEDGKSGLLPSNFLKPIKMN